MTFTINCKTIFNSPSCNIFAILTIYTHPPYIHDDRIMHGRQFHKRYNSPVTSLGEWIRAMYY